MCRLSIVVPYDRDEAAFETTLVSVLENRPEYCEVIVPHDGQYDDPFDLGDEVRFVVAADLDSVSLIRAAVAQSLGRVVHVMQGGVRATENWTEEPLSMFEQADLGCVSPVIRDLSSGGKIVAAGWRDAGGRLQQPIARGRSNPSRQEIAGIQGVYLAASFWRRTTLEAILELPVVSRGGALDYVLATALQQSEWRCRLAAHSDVIGSPMLLAPASGSVKHWSSIQAFRAALGKERGVAAVLAGMLGVLLEPFQLSSWSECLGRATAAFATNEAARELADELRQLCPTIGPQVAADKILKLPRAGTYVQAERRAA